MDVKYIAAGFIALLLVLVAVFGYANATTTDKTVAAEQTQDTTCSASCCGNDCGSCCAGGSCSKGGEGTSSCGC